MPSKASSSSVSASIRYADFVVSGNQVSHCIKSLTVNFYLLLVYKTFYRTCFSDLMIDWKRFISQFEKDLNKRCRQSDFKNCLRSRSLFLPLVYNMIMQVFIVPSLSFIPSRGRTKHKEKLHFNIFCFKRV